jgi:hypothetical protein
METISKLMVQSENGMTPIDVAGTHHSHEAALLIIEYFCERFHYIEKIFGNLKEYIKACNYKVKGVPADDEYFLRYVCYKEFNKV